MPIKNRFSEMLPEIAAWRQDFHAHPELMYDTYRTSERVTELLEAFGCDEVVGGIGKTGVVGVIRGRSDSSGRVIGMRADMDALPILEETGVDYASQTPGKMHACGHDGHTAMLLGAAKYLAETRNFDGTVVVIFQPAEEGGAGGLAMVEDGMMERWNVQEVYGMHNWPMVPAGEFAIRPGAFFAATDHFEIDVIGKGGHAASPDDCIDPVVMSAHLVQALQTITSRTRDPVKHLVLSITSMVSSSTAHNVIPQSVQLKGTVRSMDDEIQDMTETRINEIAAATATMFGGQIDVHYHRNYPVMVNSARETEFAAQAAKAVAGDCAEAPTIMAGEDFSYMLNARPGAYILIGNGESAPLHHPKYNFEDDIIPKGCSWFAEIAESRMPL